MCPTNTSNLLQTRHWKNPRCVSNSLSCTLWRVATLTFRGATLILLASSTLTLSALSTSTVGNFLDHRHANLMAANNKEKIVRLIAYGQDVDDPEFYYIEKHEQIWQKGRLQRSQIHIYNAEDRLIVMRRMDFRQFLFHPDYWLKDYRIGQRKSIHNVSSKQTEFAYKPSKNRKDRKKTRTTPSNAIIYDGINVYVQKNFREIVSSQLRPPKSAVAKQKVEQIAGIAFADAKFQFYIDLELQFQEEILYTPELALDHPQKSPEHRKFKAIPAYLFRLISTNALIKALIPRTRFMIAKDDGRLLRYEGPTPFNNRKNQKNFTTITEYHLIR